MTAACNGLKRSAWAITVCTRPSAAWQTATLKFERQLERAPNHWGEPCTVTRYTLPDSERRCARNVLLMLCKPVKQRQKVAA